MCTSSYQHAITMCSPWCDDANVFCHFASRVLHSATLRFVHTLAPTSIFQKASEYAQCVWLCRLFRWIITGWSHFHRSCLTTISMSTVDVSVLCMGRLRVEEGVKVRKNCSDDVGFHLRDVPCTFDRATFHVVNYFGSK